MQAAIRRRGFTLLELLIGLAIAAIALALAIPGLGRWLAEQQLQDRADALLRGLDLARSEAIRTGSRVDVCPAGLRCGGGALPWESGWVVIADAARADGPAIAGERASPPNVTIRGNRPVADYVSYTSL